MEIHGHYWLFMIKIDHEIDHENLGYDLLGMECPMTVMLLRLRGELSTLALLHKEYPVTKVQ